MKISKNIVAVTGITLMVGMMLVPVGAEAGRFRGAGTGTGVHLLDTDGDGVGDTQPTPGSGMGVNAINFVDADGDGVCDTYAAGGQQLLDGSGAAAASGRRGLRGRRR